MEKATWFNLPKIVTDLIERIELLEEQNKDLEERVSDLE